MATNQTRNLSWLTNLFSSRLNTEETTEEDKATIKLTKTDKVSQTMAFSAQACSNHPLKAVELGASSHRTKATTQVIPPLTYLAEAKEVYSNHKTTVAHSEQACRLSRLPSTHRIKVVFSVLLCLVNPWLRVV